MRARDIMTSHPLVVTGEDTISHAAEIMRDAEVGIVPVVDDREHRRLIGVLTDRDIAVRCVSHRHVPACDVRLHMSADHLHTVAPTTTSIASSRRWRTIRCGAFPSWRTTAGSSG